MSLTDFLKEYYPDTLDQFKRMTTPNYFECGVLYQPLVNGFGGKLHRKLLFKDATIYKDHNDFHFIDIDDNTAYCVTDKEAPFKLKRIEENVAYRYNIIDNKRQVYITVDGIVYSIHQLYFRNCRNQQCFRLFIRIVGNDNLFCEYYNFGINPKGNILCYYPNYKVDKNNYTINFNTPVRKMKEIVFGNPNVKIK